MTIDFKNRIFKILYFLIFVIFIILFGIRYNFAENVFSSDVDPILLNSYLAEDESTNPEIISIVNNFYNTRIKDNMTDFQKEIEIIKYLVETVTYDDSNAYNISNNINNCFKAYGALVEKKAVCSGYAKAFYILAERCKLNTIIVTGIASNTLGETNTHAWNQICLDNEWYNVDVTFEDPVTNVNFGGNNLRNQYINVTDNDISKNHYRENGYPCIATKYNHDLISYYLLTGIISENANLDSARDNIINQIEINSNNNILLNYYINQLMTIGSRYDDNSNYFKMNDDYLITSFVLDKIASGKKAVILTTDINSNGKTILESGHWMDDYINLNINISMQVYYFSGEKYDTRVLIFNY